MGGEHDPSAPGYRYYERWLAASSGRCSRTGSSISTTWTSLVEAIERRWDHDHDHGHHR